MYNLISCKYNFHILFKCLKSLSWGLLLLKTFNGCFVISICIIKTLFKQPKCPFYKERMVSILASDTLMWSILQNIQFYYRVNCNLWLQELCEIPLMPRSLTTLSPLWIYWFPLCVFFSCCKKCSLDWILEVTIQLSHNTNVNGLKGGVYNWKFDAYIFTSNPTRGMGIKEWNYGKHFRRKLEHHLFNLHQSKFFLLLWANLKCSLITLNLH